MPVKRRNGGRQKKNRGSVNIVQCIQCGACVPKDKGVSRATNNAIIEQASMDDLNLATIYSKPDVPNFFNIDNYCISCACHLRIVKVRSECHRKERFIPRSMRPRTTKF